MRWQTYWRTSALSVLPCSALDNDPNNSIRYTRSSLDCWPVATAQSHRPIPMEASLAWPQPRSQRHSIWSIRSYCSAPMLLRLNRLSMIHLRIKCPHEFDRRPFVEIVQIALCWLFSTKDSEKNWMNCRLELTIYCGKDPPSVAVILIKGKRKSFFIYFYGEALEENENDNRKICWLKEQTNDSAQSAKPNRQFFFLI